MRAPIALFLLLPGCLLLTRFPFPECGNGIHEFSSNDDKNEECDDGNVLNGDGCDQGCRLEVLACGNGQLDAGEVCDDGNVTAGDGCRADCLGQELCGDGQSDAITGEVCDDGNASPLDDCADCAETACGDNIVQPNSSRGELCDDGNNAAGDGCDAQCQPEPNANCGDNITQPGEACDDGNTASGDGCNADCSAREECGDGITQSGLGEACDDANTNNTDACDDTCQLTTGCGNGVIDSGEQCDDANTSDNDGCNNVCQLEADLFVSCGLTTGANNGTLAGPFRTLPAALSAAATNQRVMILPQSPGACGGATINKSLSLYGFASRANPPAVLPLIDGAEDPALFITGNSIKVVVHGLRLRSNDFSTDTVDLSALTNADLAFSQVDIQNLETSAAGIFCNATATNLFIDRSFIHNSEFGVGVINTCALFVTNSLFLQNETDVEIDSSAITPAQIFYSVFDQTLTKTATCLENVFLLQTIEGSIFNNVSNATRPTGCTVSFSNSFGSNVNGASNINQNPQFVAGGAGPLAAYRLGANSPCRGTGGDAPDLLVDPVQRFGALNAPLDFDFLRHDGFGNPRPVGLPDMGLSEEP